MLQITQKPQYLQFLASYKAGNRFNVGTPEYNQIRMLESLDPHWTTTTRLSNGVNVPSLTYTETMTTTTTPGKPGASGEQLFNVSTPITTNIGLPPGSTPTGTETTPGTTSESFISKYKMPLIIGAVAIGYFFLKKKK